MKKIDKEKIILELNKHLDKFMRAMFAERLYYSKTFLQEIKSNIAYSYKVKEMFENLQENSAIEPKTLEHFILYKNLVNVSKKEQESDYLTKTVTGNAVVSSVSSLDYFIYQCLHTIFTHNENMINSLDLKLQYEQIKTLETVEEVKELSVSNFIEGLLFGSHDELFGKLENNYSIKNIKKIKDYKDFIFIAEIRNIIVHHDAKISVKFKSNMKKYKLNHEKYDFFDKNGYVSLSPDRIHWAIDTCIKFGLQLYLEFAKHFSLRAPELKKKYLLNINELCLELILKNQSEIAESVYNVVLGDKNNSELFFLFAINKALCMKRLNREDEMKEYLNSLKWDECKDIQYILAKHILLNEYDKATEYMDKVDLYVWNCGYQEWPLCLRFIKSDCFKEKYKEIYGIEFEKRIKDGTLSDEEIEEFIECWQKKDN
ncbi:MAG: hypothetical protein E7602_08610 [Ruminococcaceae bacterium]|nr:hypothetical protein [Oscillospiraceae bacterium]